MTTRRVDEGGFRGRAGLWVLTAALFGLVVYVTWRYVGTFVLGLFLYYVTRPVHSRIHHRVRSRTLSVTLALVSVAIPVLLLVLWTISVVVSGLRDVVGGGTVDDPLLGLGVDLDPASVFAFVESTARALLVDPRGWLSEGLGQGLLALVEALSGSFLVVVDVGLHLFIALIIVFFLLRDDYRIVAWARSTVVSEGGTFEAYARAVDRDLTQVYFGNILNAVLTGVLGAVTYSLLNLVAPTTVRIPEPALFGLLTGVGSLVPVIGIKVVWVPLALVLLVDAALTDPSALWFVVVFAVVSVVVVDTLPDQVLRPYVSGRSLHVGGVMLAYTVGPLLFGWYGVFLGPLLLVLVLECARHVFPALLGRSPPSVDTPAGAESHDPAADDPGSSTAADGANRGDDIEATGGTEPTDESSASE